LGRGGGRGRLGGGIISGNKIFDLVRTSGDEGDLKLESTICDEGGLELDWTDRHRGKEEDLGRGQTQWKLRDLDAGQNHWSRRELSTRSDQQIVLSKLNSNTGGWIQIPESICCILHFMGNKGPIWRLHLKEPLSRNSDTICLRSVQPRKWDAAYEYKLMSILSLF